MILPDFEENVELGGENDVSEYSEADPVEETQDAVSEYTGEEPEGNLSSHRASKTKRFERFEQEQRAIYCYLKNGFESLCAALENTTHTDHLDDHDAFCSYTQFLLPDFLNSVELFALAESRGREVPDVCCDSRPLHWTRRTEHALQCLVTRLGPLETLASAHSLSSSDRSYYKGFIEGVRHVHALVKLKIDESVQRHRRV